MRIGILGSGLIGGTLGTLCARAGHEVVFSYARSARKLRRLAENAGGRARASTPLEAAQTAEVLLLAVHWRRLNDVLRQAGSLSGKIIITCSLPMNAANTALVVGHTSSGAEALARKVRSARVVAAVSTVPSEVLPAVFRARRRAERPSLVVCGDNPPAKTRVARLARDVGFEPLDVGPLRLARYTEPFSLLVAQVAYERGSIRRWPTECIGWPSASPRPAATASRGRRRPGRFVPGPRSSGRGGSSGTRAGRSGPASGPCPHRMGVLHQGEA